MLTDGEVVTVDLAAWLADLLTGDDKSNAEPSKK
jgi:hypothetical protein